MQDQPGIFDVDDWLKRLSDFGDQLEAFRAAVDFEIFCPELNAAPPTRVERKAGDRPSMR
jgi:IS5 family transposase